MNEERLARGKRIDNGQWAKGYYALLPTKREEPEHIIIEPVDSIICLWHGPLVDPNTVGRCTGLKDWKGKLIFEGDIICFSENAEIVNYVVEWYDGGFVYRDVKIRAFGSELTQSDANEVEIVGNIHDNPELLHSYGTMRKE